MEDEIYSLKIPTFYINNNVKPMNYDHWIQNGGPNKIIIVKYFGQ